MKHWDTVYQDNHLSLMKIHFGLAIFYVLIMSGILFLILNDVSCSQIQWGNFLILVIIMIIPSSVHMALAYGARAKCVYSAFFDIPNWQHFLGVRGFSCFTMGKS